MIDVNRLCPRCMREMDDGIQKMRVREEAPQGRGFGKAQEQKKCPYCGFCADTYKQNARCLPLYTILAGKYLVGAVLGEGGFGITYIGYDLNMQTRIAIKEYFPVELVSRDTTSMTGDRVISMSGDKSETYKQGLKKYVAEAQNVSQFSEIPGVVSVKDFFYENETAYIVMEYIDGISLKDYLKERGGRLSEEETLAIMKPVLEALVKVHEAGIVHRDISPDNIMLTFENRWNSRNLATNDGADTGQSNATPGHGAAARPGNTAGLDTGAGDSSAASGHGAAARPGSAAGLDTGAGDSSAASGHGAAARPGSATGFDTGAGDSSAAPGRGAAARPGSAIVLESAAEPGNFPTSVKLIDFGAARMTAKNDQKSLTIILKHGYAPEEQYRTRGEQGPWTDVYAVCAVLYRMLTGQTPVPAMDRMFQDGLKSFAEMDANVTKNTQAAILKGLAVKKEDRFQDIQELMAVLYEAKRISGFSKVRRQRAILIAAASIAGVCVLFGGIFAAYSMRRHPETRENMDSIVQGDTQESGQNDLQSAPQAEPESGPQEEQMFLGDTSAGDELGETIVLPDPQTSISLRTWIRHVLFRMPDGSVKAIGSNDYGQCMVQDWSDIAAVSAGYDHSLGLRCDGRVFAVGQNWSGQCEVETWEGVVQIAAGGNSSYGLTKEGRILTCGMNRETVMDELMQLENIVAITTELNDGLIALDGEGNLHFVDCDGHWTSVSGWQGVKHLDCNASTLIGLKEDGTVVQAMATDEGDTVVETEAWTGIQQMLAKLPRLGVRKDGTVAYADFFEEDVKKELEEWSDMTAIALLGSSGHGEYIVGMEKDGTIREYHPNYGNASLDQMSNLEWIQAVNTSGYVNLVAGTKDGKLLTYGTDFSRLDKLAKLYEETPALASEVVGMVGEAALLLDGGRVYYFGDSVEEIENRYIGENVVQAVEVYHSEAGSLRDVYAFLMEDGNVEMKFPGDLEGSLEYTRDRGIEEWTDAILRMQEAGEWTDVVQLAVAGGFLYGLHSDGSVSSTVVFGGTEIPEQDIVRMACGDQEIIGITPEGTAVSILADEYAVALGRTQLNGWDNLQDISIGESHVVGLRKDGTVIAAGGNHVNQCDVEDWTDIVFILAEKNCTLGLTSQGELKMAGSLY